jgi:hypothetical protein
VIAREGEFVSMAGFIKMMDPLSMIGEVSHARLYQKNFGKSKRVDGEG